MDASQKKSSVKPYFNDTLIESLRDMGRGVAKTVKSDLVGGIANDALSSLFGTPKSGHIQPGEEISFDRQPQPPPYPERQPFHFGRREQYFSQYSQEVLARLRAQEKEVAQKIEEIRHELKALIATLKVVDQEIAQATENGIVEPGLYHLTFLDRLKTILKLLRQNLHESRSWLAVMRSKKKQRTYWALYKKKGTEFGLNPDRVIATQVG